MSTARFSTASPGPLPERRPLRIGLTGGIASGKSLIEDELKRHGVPTLDADAIVHELLRLDHELKAQIRAEFGESVFAESGEIDRKRLGEVVFGDTQKRKLLEGLIHPKVRARINAFYEQCAREQQKLGVAVIPLLFESGLQDQYDVIWLVKSTEAQQTERLRENRGMTREEALARINSQMPLADKLKKLQAQAHYRVIDNTGPAEDTRQQIASLLNELG